MKRYEIDSEMCDASKVMDEEPDGAWVYYDDHLAALAGAEEERDEERRKRDRRRAAEAALARMTTAVNLALAELTNLRTPGLSYLASVAEATRVLREVVEP